MANTPNTLPAVRGGSVQDGQYLDYVYRIHKVRFAQVFRADLEELGITAEEALGEDYVPRGEIFDMTSALSDTDDTVQVLEHWFRQPVETSVDGETIPAVLPDITPYVSQLAIRNDSME